MMEVPHRLYLSKNNEVVYIDNCKGPQYLIDGLRFLYRQFKLKKPGLIINDPSKSSRDVQIVLFIKTACHLLDKPVLVLCQEGAEKDWLEQFRMRTDLNDDVVIETSKPYLRKKVLINPASNLAAFSQQHWGIVVVADDSSAPALVPFKAGFKIWSTAVDMKMNLATFSFIYAWLIQENGKSKHPKDKFNMSDFVADKANVRDVIDKAVLLDAFMDDIVIRRKEIDCNLEDIQETLSIPKKISKKNKDASGTKIKRSKRKTENNTSVNNDVSNEATIPKLHKTGVHKENPLRFANYAGPNNVSSVMDFGGQAEEINIDEINSQDSEMKLIYEADSLRAVSDEIYKVDTFSDTPDIIMCSDNTIVQEDINMNCEKDELKSNAGFENEIDSEKSSYGLETKIKLPPLVIPETEESSNNELESIKILDDSQYNDVQIEKPDMNNIYFDKVKEHETSELNVGMNSENDNKLLNEILAENHTKPILVNIIVENEIYSESGQNADNTCIEIPEPVITEQNSHDCMESINKIKEAHHDKLNVETEKLITVDQIEIKNETIPNEIISRVIKPIVDDITNVTINSEDNAKSDLNTRLDLIDQKNNDLKEQVRKRFKGSFLDNIF